MIFLEPEERIGRWKQRLSEHVGGDAACWPVRWRAGPADRRSANS